MFPNVTTDNYFDAAQALYWYCSDWHSGQNSIEYSIMSARLHYTPGCSERGIDQETEAREFYAALEDKSIDPEALLSAIDRAYEASR
jgi:hypothetical protein